MSDQTPSPKQPCKNVYCQKCKRFMFKFVVTMDSPPSGPIGEIKNFRCAYCKSESMVLVGVFDADLRDDKEKLEDRLRAQIEEQK